MDTFVWKDIPAAERSKVILFYQHAGYTQTKIAEALQCTRETVHDFCRRNSIGGWRQGAQIGNSNAKVNGMGKNTIRRLTKRILIEAGRDLHTCEKCGFNTTYRELARHHKDRDRSNNDPNNLEVLCHTCHAQEHIQDKGRNSNGQIT